MGEAKLDKFGILMYHRVTPRVAGVDPPTWNVPPQQFRRQLTGLLSRGYRAWPLRQILEHCAASKPIPPRTFVVTFDDGYDNFYHYAWPVLKELGIPATVFIATAYLDSPAAFPFDDWTAAGATKVPQVAWQPLSTAHCRELLEFELVEFGSHTDSHNEFLGRPDAFRKDLKKSLERLYNVLGYREPAFAFPYGHYNEELIEAAREAGVACSLTTEPRIASAAIDPFHWGRFTATARDTGLTLAMKLNGWYSAARIAWHCLVRWEKARPTETPVHVERCRWDHCQKSSRVGLML